MSGGLGAKKVDVTWATEESGLMLAISIKTINFHPFQKNLTNRRGDMLYEAVTLHRRFPYAVLGGFFFFDYGAAQDLTDTRKDTVTNAHSLLKIFTGRRDPAGREEQYEGLYIGLIDSSPFQPRVEIREAGKPDTLLTLHQVFDGLLSLVADRNPDFYDFQDGVLLRAGKAKGGE